MSYVPLPAESPRVGHLVLGQLPSREKVIFSQNPQELFNSAIFSARESSTAAFDNAYARYHQNSKNNKSQPNQVNFGRKLCYGLYIDKFNQTIICHVCGCSKSRMSDLTAHVLTLLHIKRFTEWANTVVLAETLKKTNSEQSSQLQPPQQQQQVEKNKVNNNNNTSEPVVKTKNRSEAETLRKLQKKAKKQNSARLKQEKKEAARIFDDVNNNNKNNNNNNNTNNSIPKVTKSLRELEKERHQTGKKNLVRALKLVLHSHKNLVLFNFTPTFVPNACATNVVSSNTKDNSQIPLFPSDAEEDFIKTKKLSNKSSTVAFADEVKVAQQKLPIRRDRIIGDEVAVEVKNEESQESRSNTFASPPPTKVKDNTVTNNDNSDYSSNNSNSNSNPKKMLLFDSKGRLDPDVAHNLAQNGFFKSFSPTPPLNPKNQPSNNNNNNNSTTLSTSNNKPAPKSSSTTTTRFSALTNAEGEVISNSKYLFCEYMRLDLGESCGLDQMCPISYNHDGSLDDDDEAENDQNNDKIDGKQQSAKKTRKDEEYVEKTKTQKGLLSLFAGKSCCFHQEETTNLLVGTITDAFVGKRKRKTDNSCFVSERRVLIVPDPQFGLPGQTFKWVDLEDIYCLPKVPENISNNNNNNNTDDVKAEYNRLLSIEIEKLRTKVTKLATLPKAKK